MTQNLRLVGSRTLTSSNSNVTRNWTLPASSTSFCDTGDTACIDVGRVYNSGNSTYGAHYTWYAATAGSGAYANASGSVAQSICPKGWGLPTGGSGGEFAQLYSKYNSYSKFTTATSGALSGSYGKPGEYLKGEGGFWWSKTASDNTGAYTMNFYSASSSVSPNVASPTATARKYVGVQCTLHFSIINYRAIQRTEFPICFPPDHGALATLALS